MRQLIARLVFAADRKSTRLNSSHTVISYAVFCLKKKKILVGPQHEDKDTHPADDCKHGPCTARRNPGHRVLAVPVLRGHRLVRRLLLFFFNDTATTEIYTLSLHDALPI